MEQLVKPERHLSLELGGYAPSIVYEDILTYTRRRVAQ